VNESEVLRWVARQWQKLSGKDVKSGFLPTSTDTSSMLTVTVHCTQVLAHHGTLSQKFLKMQAEKWGRQTTHKPSLRNNDNYNCFTAFFRG